MNCVLNLSSLSFLIYKREKDVGNLNDLQDLCISTFYDSTISHSGYFAYLASGGHSGKSVEAWNSLLLLSDVLDPI